MTGKTGSPDGNAQPDRQLHLPGCRPRRRPDHGSRLCMQRPTTIRGGPVPGSFLRVAGETLPFPGSSGVIAEFEKLEAEIKAQESEQAPDIHAAVAGRVVAMRDMGKAAFLDLEDRSGRMQLMASSNGLGEAPTSLMTM